jgi:K+-sensing histidine kinase KdpD
VEFARRNQIAQILLARPHYNWLNRAIGSGARSPSFVMKVIQRAKDTRVVIVAERRPAH